MNELFKHLDLQMLQLKLNTYEQRVDTNLYSVYNSQDGISECLIINVLALQYS